MTVPLNNLTDTWNNSGSQFTAIQMNVTNTASAAGSSLIDLQVGGTSSLRADIHGDLRLCNSTNSGSWGHIGTDPNNGGIAITTSTDSGLSVNNDYFFSTPGWGSGGPTLALRSDAFFSWASATQVTSGTLDTRLYRDAAATLAQRNGTNTQVLRVYDTFTDASNYTRFSLNHASGNSQLTLENAGTGPGHTFFVQNLTGNSLVITAQGATAELNVNGVFSFGVSRANTSYMNWSGQARATADVSFTSTTTLAIITGLSVALLAGRTYAFEAFLPFTCLAAGGARAGMQATAGLTATNIIYDGWIVDSAANGIKGNTQATALGTAVGAVATAGAAGHIMIRGTITVNVAGTLNVYGAQGVSSTTATVFKRGCYLQVMDVN